MVVFQSHSSIFYRKAKNIAIKINVFNLLINHHCFDKSLFSIDVFETCPRSVYGVSKKRIKDPTICMSCWTSVE